MRLCLSPQQRRELVALKLTGTKERWNVENNSDLKQIWKITMLETTMKSFNKLTAAFLCSVCNIWAKGNLHKSCSEIIVLRYDYNFVSE